MIFNNLLFKSQSIFFFLLGSLYKGTNIAQPKEFLDQIKKDLLTL